MNVSHAACLPTCATAGLQGSWGLRCQSSWGLRTLSSVNSSQSQQQQGQHSSKPSSWGLSAVAAAAAGMLFFASGSSLADVKRAAKVNAKVEQQQQSKPTGAAAADATGNFPEYTADEVAKHKAPKDRVWVTYKDGVYDITDFIAQVCSAAGSAAHCK